MRPQPELSRVYTPVWVPHECPQGAVLGPGLLVPCQCHLEGKVWKRFSIVLGTLLAHDPSSSVSLESAHACHEPDGDASTSLHKAVYGCSTIQSSQCQNPALASSTMQPT